MLIYFQVKPILIPFFYRIEYDLFLQEMNGTPLLSHVRTERIIFFKPSEEFKRKVLACGGVRSDFFYFLKLFDSVLIFVCQSSMFHLSL